MHVSANSFRCIAALAFIACVAGCFDHPSAGNNQGGTRRGSRGIEYHSFRHNSLYAVAGWHVDSEQPLFLMIFRVENRPSGQEPHASHGYKDGTGQPGFQVTDFSQKTTWSLYAYDESVAIFGKDYAVDEGRIFVADTTTSSPDVAQLSMPIPFAIPKDDNSSPKQVLFAVQDLAEQDERLNEFLQQHEDTIEFLNRSRE